jgi:hypothetical protein
MSGVPSLSPMLEQCEDAPCSHRSWKADSKAALKAGSLADMLCKV